MMIPRSIQEATRQRAIENKDHRRRALRRALEAPAVRRDPDPERRLEWLMRELDIDRATAEGIDAGAAPLRAGVPADRVCEVLAYQETDDLHDVMFLARATRAALSVGRFVPAGTEGAGTFFMISPDLLLTNHHVIGKPEIAEEMQAEFCYEVDEDGEELEVTHFKLAPERLFISDEMWDYTVIALGDYVDGPTGICIGVSPLVTEDLHAIGPFVNIIQHPRAQHKQIVFRENRLLCAPTEYLTYSADALTGSSGSPVYNDDWKVVGLHHSAVAVGTLELCSDLHVPDNVNEGIYAVVIIDDLKKKLEDGTANGCLNEAQQALLRTALRM